MTTILTCLACYVVDILWAVRCELSKIELGDVVDIFNLIFVMWVFIHDKKQQTKKNEKDYRMAWYRTFDMAENLKDFRKVLDSTKVHLVKFARSLPKKKDSDIQKYAKKSLETFNNGIGPEKRKLETILLCISEQDRKNIAYQFNEFQDHLSTLINSGINSGRISEGDIDIALDNMEKELTRILYETGLQFV